MFTISGPASPNAEIPGRMIRASAGPIVSRQSYPTRVMMKKFYEFICRQEMQIAKYSLGLLSLLVFVAAVARSLHYPLNWAMDAATFLFAWTVFLGADAAMRLDRLFCIEVISSRLSPKAQLYLKIVNYSIIAIFLVGMIGYGIPLSYTTRFRAFQGIPGFSYSWVTLSVPIGCAVMLITAILKIKAFWHAIATGEVIARGEGVSGEII